MIVQCTSLASSWVPVVVAQTEDRPTTAPTERSIPPAVITKVMPIDTTPMTEASRRMVSTLSVLANRSPAVMTPTRHSSSQRDDQAEVAHQPRRQRPSRDARRSTVGGDLRPRTALAG